MLCPYCSAEETKVLETRETSEMETRRRRECLKCERRFTTYERVELKPILVLKKDGKREEFDRQKIVKGLLRACEKRDVSVQDIEGIAEAVEYKIRSLGLQEVKTSKIGTLVMNRLKKIDKVAYVRFASVYKDYDDVSSFEDEISKLTQAVIEKNIQERMNK